MEVLVDAVMHRGVIACAPDCSGVVVARIMAAHRIHSVVVTSEGSEPRVVTDADVASALVDGLLERTTAAELARGTAVVRPEDTVHSAARCMYENETTHAVVVDGARPIGVLSVLDLAEAIAAER